MSKELEVKKSLSRFWSKKTNKVLFALGGVLLAVLLAALSYFVWAKYYGPVAVINGEKITRAEYNEMVPKYKKIYEQMKDTKSVEDIDQVALDRMRKDLIVETEAEKRGISVSSSEIENEMNKMATGAGSMQKLVDNYNGAYGWDKTLLEKTVKDRLLEEKLAPAVVSSKDIQYFIVYADSNNMDAVKKVADTTYSELNSGTEFYATIKKVQDQPEWAPSHSYKGFAKAITEGECGETFSGAGECEAIKALKTTGQVSAPLQVGEHYQIIFRAQKVNNGDFATWQDFIDSFNYKPAGVFSYFAQTALACIRMTETVDNEDPGSIEGTVSDVGTNTTVADGFATVDVTNAQDGDAYCWRWKGPDGSGNEYNVKHSSDKLNLPIKTLYHTSPNVHQHRGYFGTGDLSCALRWNVKLNVPAGYRLYDSTKNDQTTNGDLTVTANPVKVNIPNKTGWAGIGFWVMPTPTLTVTKAGVGAGTVYGTNIDCGATCAATFDYNSGQTLTAIPDDTSAFDFWSGDCNASGYVVMTGAKTCTANFKKAPASCPVFGTSTTISKGETATLTWTIKNATSAWINGEAIPVSQIPSGSKSVQPLATTTYVITADGPGGTSVPCPNTVTVKVRDISGCTATPGIGQNPLVTKVTTLFTELTDGQFVYNFGETGAASVTGGSTVYHTYGQAGTYVVSVTHPEYKSGLVPIAVTCSPTSGVVVKDPSTNEGGEVRP